MALERPTITDIRTRIRQDVNAELPGADALLRHSNVGVLAGAFAGAAYGLYGYLDAIAGQVAPATATGAWLDRWAAVWGVPRAAAQAATGSVALTGQDGETVPAGAVLARADGVEYTTDASVTIAGGMADATITAREVGDAGDAPDGANLTFRSPLAGVDAAAVAGAILGGADAEGDDALRARLLARIQRPPHGGSAADFEAWALDRSAHGVAVGRAWVSAREMGLGSVTVRFLLDGDVWPSSSQVSAVADYLDQVAPVNADVFVAAPVAAPVDVSIRLRPDTAALRAAVTASLEALIARDAAPGAGLLVSRIREAISTTPGELDHALDAPAADVLATAPGEIATLGTVSFSTL